MSNQSGVQAACRAYTSATDGDYNANWLDVFDEDEIAAGTFNERMLLWLNDWLGASYASLPQAQQAFAESQGYINWSSMRSILFAISISGTFTAGAGGATSGIGFIEGGDDSWAEEHEWGGPFGTMDEGGVSVAAIWDVPDSTDTYLVLRGAYAGWHARGVQIDVTVDDGVNDPVTVRYSPLTDWGRAYPDDEGLYHSVWINTNDTLELVDETTYDFTIAEVAA